MLGYAQRAGTADDFDFAYDLYRSQMAPLTIEALGRWRDDGQRPVVRAGLAGGDVRIVELDGRPVGWLQHREREGRTELLQIYVDPAVQGRGLGTALLRELQARGLPIELSVLRNNARARALYQRLGFEVVSESAHKQLMRWTPRASSGTRGSGPG